MVDICKLCKEDVSPNSTVFCEEHLLKNRERGRVDRQRRKDEGLCRSCNKPISPKSKTWCDEHHEKQNEASRDNAQRIRANQLCQDCGENPRLLRKRRCGACQTKFDAHRKSLCKRVGCEEDVDPNLKYYCREHGNEENEKLKLRRQKLKSENKCIFCFESIDETESHILCVNCRYKQREQRKTATV
jgi:hypothetical protein